MRNYLIMLHRWRDHVPDVDHDWHYIGGTWSQYFAQLYKCRHESDKSEIWYGSPKLARARLSSNLEIKNRVGWWA